MPQWCERRDAYRQHPASCHRVGATARCADCAGQSGLARTRRPRECGVGRDAAPAPHEMGGAERVTSHRVVRRFPRYFWAIGKRMAFFMVPELWSARSKRIGQGDRTILTRLPFLTYSVCSAAPTKTPHERRRAQRRAPGPSGVYTPTRWGRLPGCAARRHKPACLPPALPLRDQAIVWLGWCDHPGAISPHGSAVDASCPWPACYGSPCQSPFASIYLLLLVRVYTTEALCA